MIGMMTPGRLRGKGSNPLTDLGELGGEPGRSPSMKRELELIFRPVFPTREVARSAVFW